MGIKLAPVNREKVKNLLNMNNKDKIPTEKKSGIYEINCKECQKSYIGKTKQNLETRVKEHFHNVKYKDIEKSAIAYHFWITQYNVENEAKLLKQAEKTLELTIWEKIFIQKNKSIIFTFDTSDEKRLDFKIYKTIKKRHVETSGGT